MQRESLPSSDVTREYFQQGRGCVSSGGFLESKIQRRQPSITIQLVDFKTWID